MTGTDLLATPTPVTPEVSHFLAQMAVALHKLRAYPAGHPMRHAAVHISYAALGDLLHDTPSFRIGVARNQLLVGDTVTDSAHFIISDVASRLHRRQVGTITFQAGLSEADFTAVLEVLAIEPPRQRAAAAELPLVSPCSSVEITPIAFDALTMQDDGDGTKADRMWQELAQLVAGATGFSGGLGGSGGGGGQGEGQGNSGDGYARAVVERLRAPEARAAFVSTLERLGRMAQTLEGDERVAVEARLGDLIATLPKEAISMLLDVDLGQRDGMTNLLPAVDWLPTVALVELIETAAKAQHQGLSGVLVRLLRKLAGLGHGAAVRRSNADRDLRTMVKSLLEDWTLADPNSKSHAHILEALTRHDNVSTADGAPVGEGIRLVQIALETEAVGVLVAEAVEMVVMSKRLDELTHLLEQSPPPNRASAEIWKTLVGPACARRIFGDPDLSETAARRLLPHVDVAGVDVLLDRLLLFRDDTVRNLVTERILALGPTAIAALLQRIQTSSGDQRRQLLMTLQSVAVLPDGFDPRVYATAPEPMVRLEALRLMLRKAADRDEAIHMALADDDERVVALALEAGLVSMPRYSLTRLMLLLNSPRRGPEIKARAIPILAQFELPTIREWLIGNLVITRGWFRRRRLAQKSPIVLAKLAVLAVRWPDHPEAVRAFDLARRSGDPELIAAVRRPGGPS